jgi:hypothetical protein
MVHRAGSKPLTDKVSNVGAGIRPNCHEAGMTNRKLTGKPVNNVEANRHDNGDAAPLKDVLVIGVDVIVDTTRDQD